MKKTFFISLITIFLLASSCGVFNRAETSEEYLSKYAVKFTVSEMLMPIFEKAQGEDKLVFVDFYAKWCAPCKVMDKEVYTVKSVGDFFNENFVSYKVDGEEGNGSNLIGLYGVKYYPTLIFFDANGNELLRKETGVSQEELISLAEQAIDLAD